MGPSEGSLAPLVSSESVGTREDGLGCGRARASGSRRMTLIISVTSEQFEEVETPRRFALTILREKPPACTEGFVQFAKQILSADRDTGLQIRWTNNRQRSLGHDQFDPEGIRAPEI